MDFVSVRVCLLSLVLVGCGGAAPLPAAPVPQTDTPAATIAPSPVLVQILALNDFHGHLVGDAVRGQTRGGAAVLKGYFDRERAQFEGATFVVHVGDLVGASPPASGLLQDEPTVRFFDSLADAEHLVATLGNHEFDEGEDELLRMLRGGTHANGPFLEADYPGSRATYICANAVNPDTGAPWFEPYTVKRIGGVEVAFIGAVIKSTAKMVRAADRPRTLFLDEASAINSYVRLLEGEGIRAFVVLLHEGGEQEAYEGPTKLDDAPPLGGRITSIVASLEAEVDVVLSAHTHEFTNALLPNAGKRPVLVTQADSFGHAYADVEFELDPTSGDIVRKTASIETAWARDVTPDPELARMVDEAVERVRPIVSKRVGRLAAKVTGRHTDSGESVLGNLVADSQARAMNAELAFMNTGGLRGNLPAGEVTLGDLLEVLPFRTHIVALTLTGAQVAELLDQQWSGKVPNVLQVSGLTYAMKPRAEPGRRATDIRVAGSPLDPRRAYRVAVNDYLAQGGGRFTAFDIPSAREIGPLDVDALAAYFAASPEPLAPPPLGRIRLSTP